MVLVFESVFDGDIEHFAALPFKSVEFIAAVWYTLVNHTALVPVKARA